MEDNHKLMEHCYDKCGQDGLINSAFTWQEDIDEPNSNGHSFWLDLYKKWQIEIDKLVSDHIILA
jgi:hypothetical protein